ncbi:amino acid ABC transporter substrate-binding protein [Hyphomicrobium sp. NDB2Meth4]|uniref:amino acid ABC transporter substrate-binding protein n=1 Tax=Hyphomicrobium sp. NDB2Meth4 TaxID=1892846 RepID=UPI000930E7AA|nr:amino acid ABC transporter substrate-binding protein [Hyphomicrobium sp. NDB2Meth4]
MRIFQHLRRSLIAALALSALIPLAPSVEAAETSTLDTIRARGQLLCGIGEEQPGFSVVGPNATRSGIDVEFCQALAAAVFGSKDAVKFWPLSANDRFKALQSGDVDVLARGATWTLSRDTELGARFTGVLFYDGQGFLTRRGNAVASVLELSGASVCALPGAMGEQGLANFFGAQRMRYQVVAQENWGDLVKAYAAGNCTVLTGDISLLAEARSKLPVPADHIILPELITKEPLGPAVRQDDPQWFAVVRWTLMALIEAEELGLTSANVDAQRASTDPSIRRFLGIEANLGQALGLPRDWAYQIVKNVGNYGEIFDRSLGTKSDLKLARGLNNSWTKGGLMYSMPFR